MQRNHEGSLVDNLSYQYDGNKITNVTDAIASGAFEGDFDTQGSGAYGYDANGNMTSDENRALTLLEYNYANLPVRILKSGGGEIEYGYDSEGRRMWKKQDGYLRSRYVRNSLGQIAAELNDPASSAAHFIFEAAAGEGLTLSYSGSQETIVSNGNPAMASKVFTPGDLSDGISIKPSGSGAVRITSFSMEAAPLVNYVNIPGAGGEMLGQRRYRVDGEDDYYYIRDHLGSVRVQIRDDGGGSGEVAAGNDFYPYGAMMRHAPGPVLEGENKFKFQGKERDMETGLDYVEARFYDSGIGVFRSIDPSAGRNPGWSPYNYTFGNPVNYFDPDGFDPFKVVVRTFIPSASVTVPVIGRTFKGDNRSFQYEDQGAHRTEHIIRVETDPAVSEAPLLGTSEHTGMTVELDKEGNMIATGQATPEYVATVSRMDANSGNNAIINATISGADNPLIISAPIDYNFTISITPGKDGKVSVSIQGTKNKFPAYEIYVKNEKTGKVYRVYGKLPQTGIDGLIDLGFIFDEINEEEILDELEEEDK